MLASSVRLPGAPAKKTPIVLAAALLCACGSSTSTVPTDDPGDDSPDRATPLALGTPLTAAISAAGDRDYYRLAIPAGGAAVRVRTFDQTGASCDLVNGLVDTYVQVLDASEQPLLACPPLAYPTPCDDSGTYRCEDATVSLAEGTAYVEVSGYAAYPFVYAILAEIVP